MGHSLKKWVLQMYFYELAETFIEKLSFADENLWFRWVKHLKLLCLAHNWRITPQHWTQRVMRRVCAQALVQAGRHLCHYTGSLRIGSVLNGFYNLDSNRAGFGSRFGSSGLVFGSSCRFSAWIQGFLGPSGILGTGPRWSMGVHAEGALQFGTGWF